MSKKSIAKKKSPKKAKKNSAKKVKSKSKAPVKKSSSSKKKKSAKKPLKLPMNSAQVLEFINHLSDIQNGHCDRRTFHRFLDIFLPTSDRGKPIRLSEYTIVIDHGNDPIEPTDTGINVNRIEVS